MLRSLLLARTPGHPGLFPDDATPINMLPRILNAYAGSSLPLATEESYWTDREGIPAHGLFDVVPIDPEAPDR
jgi:hypothetical protein